MLTLKISDYSTPISYTHFNSNISWVGYVGDKMPDKISEIAQILFDAIDAAFNLVEPRFDEGKEVRGY